MDIEKREVYRAIAEMAYVMAKAENGISSEERIAFVNIIEEEFGEDSWIAQSHFELLDDITLPTLDKAYNSSMFELKKYKSHLTPELKEKALRVLRRVADSFGGFGESEAFVLDRFKKDLNQL